MLVHCDGTSFLALKFCSFEQIPDAKQGKDCVDAVLVDEEAIGSVDRPGCGAKILYGDGALERFLHQTSRDEMVCFLS